jgi:flagellar protein FlaG
MGFSLIAAAALLGLSLFMAVEIITSDLLPTIEGINDSYDDMNDRFQEQLHTDINITTVSRSLNGSNYDYNVSVKNTGSETLDSDVFIILINGSEYEFTFSQAYLYPENTVYFRIANVVGTEAKRIKVITNNGIADYYTYMVWGKKMGFSLTGTHVIFFVAAVIVAGMVSGVFIAVTMNVTTSLSNRGDRIKEQLDTNFVIINDPNIIPMTGAYYIFYLKNIGEAKLTTTNQTFQVFIDGELIAISQYYFENTSIPVEGVTNLFVNATLTTGDHMLRVVGPQGIDKDFTFRK